MSEKRNNNLCSRRCGGRSLFNNQGSFYQQRKINELERLQCSLKFYPCNANSEEK